MVDCDAFSGLQWQAVTSWRNGKGSLLELCVTGPGRRFKQDGH